MKISINLTGPERKACIDCVMGLQDNENDQGFTEAHASQLAEVVAVGGGGGERCLWCFRR